MSGVLHPVCDLLGWFVQEDRDGNDSTLSRNARPSSRRCQAIQTAKAKKLRGNDTWM
jgi:hypothetical protein